MMTYLGKVRKSIFAWKNRDFYFLRFIFKRGLRQIKKRIFFKFSYTRKNLLVKWRELKENYSLRKKFNLVEYKSKSSYKRNFKSFKKNYSLGIKHILYQSSVHRFRKKYKRTFFKKNKKNIKSFFFKSLEMSLIKFSLIDNLNWFNFLAKNQTLFDAHPLYSFAKSKHIKEFFDIFTKSNLFNQIKKIKFLYSRHYFRRIHNKRNIFADFDSNKQKFPWWETLIFTKQTYKHRLSWRGQQFWFHNPFLLYTFKYYYRYKKPWEEKKKNLYSNFSHLVFNMTKKNTLYKPKRVKQLLNRIVLPIYGHIKPQQLKAIYRRNHFVKSKEITSSNLLLYNLENRLDTLIYRLNLAPNIIWARRLIKAGLVFLQRKKSKTPILNYFQKKKIISY